MIHVGSIVILRHMFTRRPSFPSDCLSRDRIYCESHTFCIEEARRAEEKQFTRRL